MTMLFASHWVLPSVLAVFAHAPSSFVPNRERTSFKHPFYDQRSARTNRNVVSTEASDSMFNIPVVPGPFSSDLLTDSWGSVPLLIKQGFDVDSCLQRGCWPLQEDLADLASDLDAESRIIKHVPGDLSSYELEIGPFEPEHVEEVISPSPDRGTRSTLLVNDVDRFYPPLADWMDSVFSFIPRWRRDDAQISMAQAGGGIGPHVDNYDVFLVQTQGLREWQVGKRLVSVQEELVDGLVDGIPVRVLKGWVEELKDGAVETFILSPGDVLYIPPRVAHCGTALKSDDASASYVCMTLSVGCRAPSAAGLVSQLAENMVGTCTGEAVRRYTDDDTLFSKEKEPGIITEAAKEQAKMLVLNSVTEFLNDKARWDELFGTFVTSPTRPRDNYPFSLLDGESDKEWVHELGDWGEPKSAVKAVLDEGRGSLYHAEGICFGYSFVPDGLLTRHRLFVNGVMYEITDRTKSTFVGSMLKIVANERKLSRASFSPFPSVPLSESVRSLLEMLVATGVLYGSEE